MHSWEGDPRPEPVQEYGTIRTPSRLKLDQSIDPRAGSWRILFAVATGILVAVFFATGNARAAFDQVTRLISPQSKPQASPHAALTQGDIEALDRQTPQEQAELLLERAVNHFDGANEQMTTRVGSWWGKVKVTPRFNSLITSALNSDDLRVRAAGIELDLVAMGAVKSPATVEHLAEQAQEGPESQRVWALWELGLLGNRGVVPERVSEILVAQLQDSDPEVRHWAVEGLAYLGTNQVIAPLLQELHDDPSPMVRERAGCSLAQSGMLTSEQRHSTIPHLLDYADDPTLDTRTHGWVYQALRDITGKDLPDDSSTWRTWYRSTGGWKESS